MSFVRITRNTHLVHYIATTVSSDKCIYDILDDHQKTGIYASSEWSMVYSCHGS